MRWTTVLQQVATKAGGRSLKKKGKFNSLALSVYFKQPDFGMKDYEILSRATAYLLSVDPPEKGKQEGPYGHLEAAERIRQMKEYKRAHRHSPAGGAGRKLTELGWLEFVPREFRPQVHVVASSHVLAPFLWRDYYPQEWLGKVRQEHCSYSLEVFDPDRPGHNLAKISLNPEPFHHPEGRDIALIHLKEEATSLKLLRGLGVQPLYLRDLDKMYQKGEVMDFDGFVVSEPNAADAQSFEADDADDSDDDDEDVENERDDRIFYSHKETGKLSFHTNDRFFAATPEPLPEGLCGAPVLDADGDLCGTVEGIVPTTHKDQRLAGSAAFIPSFVMKVFLDYVERGMVKQMMPPDLFEMVEIAKKTNTVGGGVFKADDKGTFTTESNWEEAYEMMMSRIKNRYSSKEYNALMDTLEEETEKVHEILDKEGGDIDDIIARVRAETLKIRELVIDQYKKEKRGEAEPSELSSARAEDDPVNNVKGEQKG